MNPKDITFEQLLNSGVPAFFDAQEIVIMIFIPITIIAIIVIIFLSNTSFFRKWVARNKKEKKVSMFDMANVLGFKKDKTGGIPIIKGNYKGKEIRISQQTQFEIRRTHIKISATFCDLFKPNFFSETSLVRFFVAFCDFFNLFRPIKRKEFFSEILLYFRLNKKERMMEWSGFENSFRISQKINLTLNEKTKLNLKYLFQKKYCNIVMRLKIQPPEKVFFSRKKYTQKNKGLVIFELPENILKDKDSLKIAMDIVVDVAKQMDEMKTGR